MERFRADARPSCDAVVIIHVLVWKSIDTKAKPAFAGRVPCVNSEGLASVSAVCNCEFSSLTTREKS